MKVVTNGERLVCRKLSIEVTLGDFPGGPVVKNPPSNAEDVGSIPGQGTKIPHATGQLNLHGATKPVRPSRASTTELTCLSERAHVLQTTEPRALEPVCHN